MILENLDSTFKFDTTEQPTIGEDTFCRKILAMGS
jgi:hypothetical protein